MSQLYKSQAEFFKSTEFKWKGDASIFRNRSVGSETFIEFVTSPNNPDGKLSKPVLQGLSVKRIFDHAYYWPHFTAIPHASDEDLMIFTLSKLTGHAGSRFGYSLQNLLPGHVNNTKYASYISCVGSCCRWALIKDENLYNRMTMFISLNSMSISRDAQLRALKLVKVALQERGRNLFTYGYEKMKYRWDKISEVFSSSKRFSLQKLEPQYCTYFQNVTGPSPGNNLWPFEQFHYSNYL